jgi:hypothetical protein
MNTTRNPARLTARRVGVLMLSAFLLYGIGSMLATSAAAPDSGDSGGASLLLTIGAAMMLLNSAAVIAIGVLMLPILRPRTPIVKGFNPAAITAPIAPVALRTFASQS